MEEYRNYFMARLLTLYTSLFILGDAALLYIGNQLGHGLIHTIAYVLFFFGPLPFIVVEVTGVAFAFKAVSDDEMYQANLFKIIGIIEIFILGVAVLVGVYLLQNGFLTK
jgi:hypothetical protein